MDDDTVTVDERELVTLKFRIQRQTADRFAELAKQHDRSTAAELRVAVVRYMSDHLSEEDRGNV